jgi:hypothetical protein
LLRGSAARKKAGFLKNQVGHELQVLVQGYNYNLLLCNGISRNYVAVMFPGNPGMINTEQLVKVDEVVGEHVTGQAAY